LELPGNALVGRYGFIEKNKNSGDMLYSKFVTGFILHLKKIFADNGRIKSL